MIRLRKEMNAYKGEVGFVFFATQKEDYDLAQYLFSKEDLIAIKAKIDKLIEMADSERVE